jgi:hypothetical protein
MNSEVLPHQLECILLIYCIDHENFQGMTSSISDVHYRVVDSIPDALNAAVELADYHSISVMWEGFDVNRHGVLTWIICGYLLVDYHHT